MFDDDNEMTQTELEAHRVRLGIRKPFHPALSVALILLLLYGVVAAVAYSAITIDRKQARNNVVIGGKYTGKNPYAAVREVIDINGDYVLYSINGEEYSAEITTFHSMYPKRVLNDRR